MSGESSRDFLPEEERQNTMEPVEGKGKTRRVKKGKCPLCTEPGKENQ